MVGAVVALLVLAVAVDLSLSPAPLPASTTVYVDPDQSSCKGGGTFSCTIVLDARNGTVTASEVRSIQINGTNTQPTVTAAAAGGSVMIVASLPSITMQRGLGDVGPSVRPPSVGSIVVDLADGTQVSVILGPGGILP